MAKEKKVRTACLSYGGRLKGERTEVFPRLLCESVWIQCFIFEAGLILRTRKLPLVRRKGRLEGGYLFCLENILLGSLMFEPGP